MIMDGTVIELNDSVFCVTRGAGKVVQIQNEFVGVSFGGEMFNYNSEFTWVKGNNRSLYWHDPIIVSPLKSSDAWNMTKELCNNMLNTFNKYGVE